MSPHYVTEDTEYYEYAESDKEQADRVKQLHRKMLGFVIGYGAGLLLIVAGACAFGYGMITTSSRTEVQAVLCCLLGLALCRIFE